jgi:site-specific DNA recombinase
LLLGGLKLKIKENNKAAIYVRVSTQKESQKDSPEHQRMLCEEKAQMEGLKVEFVYEDRSSGSNINDRDEIKEMLEDAQKGMFSTIIFASLSRFARDTSDALNLKKKFVNFLGLRLISIEDTYDSLVKDDELLFTIISSVNQKLSEQIALSSRRGIKQSAMKGNFTGSKAPFGYKKVLIKVGGDDRKSLEILEEQAEIVRKIFDLYVSSHMGEKAIVNYLNEEGIPSPKSGEWGYMEKGVLFPDGGIWGITTIQKILQNEAYTGRNVFSKYTVQKVYLDINNMENRTKRLRQKDKEDWNRIEDPLWDAIIDDEIFEKAQKIRLQRGGGKRGGIRNVKVNPFAGLVTCAHCGSNFVSMKSGKTGKNGREYRYLICSKRRRLGVKGCKNNLWVPLAEFKDATLNLITQRLKSLINVEEVSASVEIPKGNEKNNVEKRKKTLEQLLVQRRKLLMGIRRDYKLNEIDKDQFELEKEIYNKEIDEILVKIEQLNKLQTDESHEEIIKIQIKDSLEHLINLNLDNIDELQLVLKKLIEEIKVDSEGEVKVISPLGEL